MTSVEGRFFPRERHARLHDPSSASVPGHLPVAEGGGALAFAQGVAGTRGVGGEPAEHFLAANTGSVVEARPVVVNLSRDILDQYDAIRVLPDGRICGVHRLLYHWTLHVDVHEDGYEDRYCYLTRELAVAALEAWDGQGDPVDWHRHPTSGRRRDVLTGREWVAP